MAENPQLGGQTSVLLEEETLLNRGWVVILFNDDFHSFDEVILQLQKATGCSLEVAEHIALTAHSQGEAAAFMGTREKCEKVSAVLEQIRLGTEIRPE